MVYYGSTQRTIVPKATPKRTSTVTFAGTTYPFVTRTVLPLPDKKYGMLTPVRPTGPQSYGKQTRFFFLWACDCGKIKEYPVKEVLSGKCKSCGCLSYNLNPSGWTRSRNPQLSSWKVLYKRYRSSAVQRNIKFDLTLPAFIDIASRNCSFCGGGKRCYSKWHEPSVLAKAKHLTSEDMEKYTIYITGVDRRDNAVGYTESNAQPCCKNCNRAKMDLNEQDFLQLVQSIYLNRFTHEKSIV